jgi:hypothetical protein
VRFKNRKIHHFLVIVILFLSKDLYAINHLKTVSFQGKENGLIVEFVFENPISPDSINAWQSQTDWFYFTLYNVLSDTTLLLENTLLRKPVQKFQPIIIEKSTQIGIKLKNRIESFEILRMHNNNTLNAQLYYPLENFASLSSVSAYHKEKRKFSSRFSRSKSWLLLIGSGYTLTGLMNDNQKMNTELKIGIGTLVFTYIIHKLWPEK